MSKKSQADYTGFCDNSVNKENFWHLRAWGSKIGPEELVDILFSLHRSNQYDAIGIEKTAYLDGLKPYLDSEQRKRGRFLPIVELDHKQTAKEIRIRGLVPRYASGSVFHVTGACNDLEEQLMRFPMNVHDDVLDACAYQLQVADSPKQTEVSVFYPEY
jgi:phage terminase large subunit-like protein